MNNDKLDILMSAVIPFDRIVEKLKAVIEQYEMDKNDDNKEHVAAISGILLTNYMTGGCINGAKDLADTFSLWDRRNKLFETENN